MQFTPIQKTRLKTGLGVFELNLDQYFKDNPIDIDTPEINKIFTDWQKNLSDTEKKKLGIVVTDGKVAYPKTSADKSTDKSPNTSQRMVGGDSMFNTTTTENTSTENVARTPEEKKWIPGLENWQTATLGGLGVAALLTVIVVVATNDNKNKKKKKK